MVKKYELYHNPGLNDTCNFSVGNYFFNNSSLSFISFLREDGELNEKLSALKDFVLKNKLS